MLSFHLCDAEGASNGWRQMASGFEHGKSWIRPFRHRALEEVAVSSDRRFLLFVRERLAGAAASIPNGQLTTINDQHFERLTQDLRKWPLQWTSLIIDYEPARASQSILAHIECSHWGTAPVFFVTGPGTLWGDWDAGRLLPQLPASSLDPARAARYLAEYANPYTRSTIFRGLHLLTERARAEWDGDVLAIAYPEPWFRPRAGALRNGEDPVATMETILSASLRRWITLPEEHIGTELSGGFDSAMVASTASALSNTRLRSYGVGLMGASAEDQAVRRAELAERFGLIDTQVPIACFLPLAPGSCRLEGHMPVLPWEDGYYEVFDELLAHAASAGTEIMFTGFGGDELFGLWPSEIRMLSANGAAIQSGLEEPSVPAFLTPSARDALSEPVEWPPRAASSESAVECAAFSAARYMRRGIWPVHPLCTPELVHFCARLPVEWRRRRRAERELLERRGCSTRITHPIERDDFSWALAATLRGPAQSLVKRLFRDSALHEMGIVDADRLTNAYDDWCDHGPRDDAVQYFAAAVTEVCLQSMR